MARVYVGELNRLDQEVLEAVKALPEDMWVFAEFNVKRNVDLFIIRPGLKSVLILTEVKRVSGALRGGDNGEWERQTATGDWEVIPAASRDINYYWQAVNTANELREFLWRNHPRYLQGGAQPDLDEFRVWPDLLLLGPSDLQHRLPMAPSTRYGQWWTSLDQWLKHVETWSPRSGVSLTPEELGELAALLRLKLVWEDPVPLGVPEGPVTPVDVVSPVAEFAQWIQALLGRVETLEHEVRETRDILTRVLATIDKPVTTVTAASRRPANNHVGPFSRGDRTWRDEDIEALRAAIMAIPEDKSRALPTIIFRLNDQLGYTLKDQGYNGFATARALFDQAERHGIVKYGPLSGPNPTIYLPHETVPLS